ncbi:hypothetical protein MHYP_G00014690 [Metynnis hypsauchen]
MIPLGSCLSHPGTVLVFLLGTDSRAAVLVVVDVDVVPGRGWALIHSVRNSCEGGQQRQGKLGGTGPLNPTAASGRDVTRPPRPVGSSSSFSRWSGSVGLKQLVREVRAALRTAGPPSVTLSAAPFKAPQLKSRDARRGVVGGAGVGSWQ